MEGDHRGGDRKAGTSLEPMIFSFLKSIIASETRLLRGMLSVSRLEEMKET